MEIIDCDHCYGTLKKDSLRRSCANCFLCTGCEIYICSKCGEEIIVEPMNIEGYNQPSADPEET